VTKLTKDQAQRGVRLADRLALRPQEAAVALGIGERTFRALLPEIPHLREGGVVLIPVDSLRNWLRERAKAEQSRVIAAVDEVLQDLGK
jgi:hypothetical protein